MDDMISDADYSRMVFAQPAQSLGIRVYQCGRGFRTWDNERGLHHRGLWSLPVYCVSLLLAGKGELLTRGEPIRKLAPGDMLFTSPTDEYSYGPATGCDWAEYWILFDGPTISTMRHHGDFPERTLWRPGLDDELIALFRRTLHVAATPRKTDVCPLLIQILHRACTLDQTKLSRPQPSHAIERIAQGIASRPEHKWDLRQLAADHGISYAVLRKAFPREFGMSPYRYVLAQRMRRAATHLLDGRSVKQAAILVSMEDPYHFSRVFKSVMGLSPQNYLKVQAAGHIRQERGKSDTESGTTDIVV